jgi:hypothetical protein
MTTGTPAAPPTRSTRETAAASVAQVDDAPSFRPSRRIRAALPDDGTDRCLADALRRERGIPRCDSVAVRAVAALQQQASRRGRLPEPLGARLVTIVVDEADADAVFEFVCEVAGIGRPGGGLVMMDRLVGATAFELPDLPDEAR